MAKKVIKCTPKQYEVLRGIVRNLSHNLEVRESYTKRAHKSRKNETFQLNIGWKNVRLLQHMKEQFK